MTGQSVGLFAKAEPGLTGTSRYASALAPALAARGWRVAGTWSRPPWPRVLGGATRRAGVDLDAFWSSFPLVPPRLPGDVLHLTTQTLATAVALSRPRRPLVVTVHDLLPWTLRNNPELGTLRRPVDRAFYRLALAGIAHADVVIAVSRYTADDVTRFTAVAPGRIRVVPQGVDAERFRTGILSRAHRERYGLSDAEQYVLYVGSEDPRKNLGSLIEGFALAARAVPTLRMLKVGQPHHIAERGRLIDLARRLGVADRIRFLDSVPDEDLPALYEAASVCVVASHYEGFGFPVLEAMACGAPVVCANRTSLPEVAGDAAVLVEPDAGSIAAGLNQVLGDEPMRCELRRRGIAQAARYTWASTARGTIAAYEEAIARRGTTDAGPDPRHR